MDIRLRKLYYSEWKNDESKNSWEIKDLCLSDQNLIVGKNAVGKSRIISVIFNLANIISLKTPLINGSWKLEFDVLDSGNTIRLKYELEIVDNKVKKEIVNENKYERLKRNTVTKIYSYKEKKLIDIDPPSDKLVLHIRRDRSEYPFLEYLINWAEGVRGYRFGNTSPLVIEIPKKEINLGTLNTVPTAVDLLDDNSKKKVIKDFNNIGYNLESVRTETIHGQPFDVKVLQIKEKGLKYFINQGYMSQGMFRALALLIILEHLLDKKIVSSILVDDLCEGLDYDRSTRFTQLLSEKIKKSNIQFIATTNDRFLMNVIPIDYWNILKREEGVVTAYSYINNKKVFDDFKLTGLSNFDFFSSNILSKLKTK